MIGVLVGLELPLLMRILKEQLDFKELVSRVLTLRLHRLARRRGALPALPRAALGLVRTSLLFGFLNGCVGLCGTWLLRPLIAARVARPARARGRS